MKLQWVTPLIEGAGNVLGYGTFCRELHAALTRHGVTFDDDAETALHVMPPIKYVPIAGKRNVAFSMWEAETIPAPMRPHLADVDLVVVPCTWNRPIFAQYVAAPVVVCPLGHDPDFTFAPRTWTPGQRFRWLHVGAPTGRKGADVLQETWARWWRSRPDVQCVLKTTIADDENAPAVRAALLRNGWVERQPLVFDHGNLTLDLRYLPKPELVRLYQAAHGFAFPTGGEGWGLTIMDSLATGLPTLCTRVGGHLDFTNADTVDYLDWAPRRSHFEGTGALADCTVESAWVEPRDLSNAMDQMMRAYPRALRKARFGARQVRTFTWDRTAQTLLRHLARSTATAAA